MAKFTDAVKLVLKNYFNSGDQPTEAQFAALIDRIQEGIEEHQHDSTGDGDGTGILNGPITMADDAWIGIGAALERIVFDAAGDISVIGAKFAVGTLTPDYLFEVAAAATHAYSAARAYSVTNTHTAMRYFMKSHHNTLGTLAETIDGDYLGEFRFYGVNSAVGVALGARITAQQVGAAGVAFLGTDLIFSTYSSTGINVFQLVLKNDGRVGISKGAPTGMLEIDQSAAGGAIPVLVLDQADVSEGLINFIASDRGIILSSTDSLKSVRVELGGVVYRLALYVNA